MANVHRGEIEAHFDGVRHRLVLTLGALAELEHAFGDEDMLALTARFEKGRLSARDCVKIIGAGLRGAGHAVTDADVSHMQADGAAAGFVEVVSRLLTATFGGASAHEQAEPVEGFGGGSAARDLDPDVTGHTSSTSSIGGGAAARAPFPGTT
ncbi:MAG: transfer Agent [Hyphomicrobium sp.]|nr:MAG: transfer Agent [Hyphomicrobium sp.]